MGSKYIVILGKDFIELYHKLYFLIILDLTHVGLWGIFFRGLWKTKKSNWKICGEKASKLDVESDWCSR